jgi:hypothetical protein
VITLEVPHLVAVVMAAEITLPIQQAVVVADFMAVAAVALMVLAVAVQDMLGKQLAQQIQQEQHRQRQLEVL